VSRGQRSSTAIRLVAVVGIALILSACGDSSAPGVLTQAEIPSYLNVKADSLGAAAKAWQSAPIPHCKRVDLALFTVPGTVLKLGESAPVPKSPIILSALVSCATVADAKSTFASYFRDVDRLGGHAVKGIGDEAQMDGIGQLGRSVDFIGWRNRNQISVILLDGAMSNKRITPALIELLGRRAAAGS
jgi:hypothetical protein